MKTENKVVDMKKILGLLDEVDQEIKKLNLEMADISLDEISQYKITIKKIFETKAAILKALFAISVAIGVNNDKKGNFLDYNFYGHVAEDGSHLIVDLGDASFIKKGTPYTAEDILLLAENYPRLNVHNIIRSLLDEVEVKTQQIIEELLEISSQAHRLSEIKRKLTEER